MQKSIHVIDKSDSDDSDDDSDNRKEKWYVINNTDDTHFCLPIGIIEHNTDISTYKKCFKQKHQESLKNIITNQNIKIEYDDDDGYVEYDNTIIKKIIKNLKNGITKFNIIASNKNTYIIDMENMIQTNSQSKHQRSIRVT